jgi:hypothetical protein
VHRAEEEVHDHVGRLVRAELPRRLAFLDQAAEALVVLAALGADRLLLVRGQLVHRLQEDRVVVEVVDAGHHDVGRRRRQALPQRRVRRGHALQLAGLLTQDAGVDLVEQVVLRAEVVVHRALGDARRLDDLLDRRAVEALLGEELRGVLQQPPRHGGLVVAGGLARLAGACSGHREYPLPRRDASG